MPSSEVLKRRVRARLDALGINPFEAERRASLKRGYVNDLLIGKKSTLREKALPALAQALECDLEYLLGTQASPLAAEDDDADGVKLSGIVEAGAWRDPAAMAAALPPTPMPIHPDPRFEPDMVRTYLVRGDHAGALGIPDGAVISVLTEDGDGYRDGDVVLARRRSSDGTTELSVRVLSGGALSARPLKGNVPSYPASSAEIIGRVISSIRVFGLAN